MKFLRFACGLLLTSVVAFAAPSQPSVLVCGGSMMNGNHFADTVLPVMREHYAGSTKIVLVLGIQS